MKNVDIDALKTRLAYLLNLAKNTSNPQEAENAFAAAQKLMTKHSLSEADAIDRGIKIEEMGSSDDFYCSPNSSLWKGKLAQALAKNNGCYFYTSHSANPIRETRFVLSGTDSNRELVIYFFHSIVEQAERLCKIRQPKGSGKNWANNFKIGLVETVADRLEKAKVEAVKESVQEQDATLQLSSAAEKQKVSTALALLTSQSQKAEAWVKNKVKLKTIYRTHRGNDSALEAGRRAGHQVSLNKGLKS